MNCRIILALLLSLFTLLSAMGQSKPADDKDDVVKITTNLVQIDVVVTKNGKPATGLRAEDFEVYEDGRRQTITSFAYVSNVGATAATTPEKAREKTVVPPEAVKRDVARRTIAIVVDDLGLSAESMSFVRRAVRKFIAEQMQPNDLVAILRTGTQVGALQQFTNDKRLLNRAVEQLRWNMCNRVGVNVLPAAGSPAYSGCPNSYRNTLGQLRSIVDAMGELPGRKSLILMSDSVPIQDQELDADEYGNKPDWAGDDWIYRLGLSRIAERAIRSSVVIYSVDTQGLQPIGPTAVDRFTGNVREMSGQMQNILSTRSYLLLRRREGGELIARQTGGFQVRNSNDFQFDRIMQDQSGYYLLGYRPTDETFNKRFHHIKAKVKRAGMSLRTRFGFYGVTEEEAKRQLPTPARLTNLALMSPFGAQELEIELSCFFGNDKVRGSLIRSFVYLDANNLTFKPVDDRYQTPLEISGVIFGDNGRVVEQVKHGVVLNLRQEEYERAKRDGLRLRFDMPAKQPGSYQVRIAVREGETEKIGSAGQFVGVPDLKNNKLALSGIVLGAAAHAAPQEVAMSNPAVRRFKVNSDLYFAFVTYNAALDAATNSPNLVMQTKLFRDGKSVKSGAETAINVTNQADLGRIMTTHAVRLTPDLEPGNYYLQILITDRAAKGKQPPVIQWVDFEILK
jgi:VWFA-related protein